MSTEEEREEKEQQRPFADILHGLLHGDDIIYNDLPRLSDLHGDDFALFKTEWSKIDEERRNIIAHHLTDITEVNFVVDFESVFVLMLSDENSDVRITGLNGLWDSVNVALIPVILGIAHDDEVVDVQVAAARTLTHYVLLAEWEELPIAAVAPIAPSLIELYDEPQTAVSLKAAILEAISPAPHPRLPVMIEDAYSSPDRQLRLSAIFAMGGTADERWLPILIEEMDGYQVDVRIEAIRAIGLIGDETAVPELINQLADEDDDIIAITIQALGEIGGDEASETLRNLLENPDYEQHEDLIDEALEIAHILYEIEHMHTPDEFDGLNGHH